jgi:hypothetical protein
VNVKNKKIAKEKNQKMATLCLMLGMFFNPFGYDILVKLILDLTNSYWTTMGIFYLVAGLFFGLSFYYSKINPLVVIKEWVSDLFKKVKSLSVKK